MVQRKLESWIASHCEKDFVSKVSKLEVAIKQEFKRSWSLKFQLQQEQEHELLFFGAGLDLESKVLDSDDLCLTN